MNSGAEMYKLLGKWRIQVIKTFKRIRESFHWHRGIFYSSFVILLMFALTMFLLGEISNSGWLTNIGFLSLGVLISLFALFADQMTRRKQEAVDLARILHAELADRVARCCYDFEYPWRQSLEPVKARELETAIGKDEGSITKYDTFRLRKFAPVPPVHYLAAADRLALLSNDTVQSVIKFYYYLSAWQRDIENLSAELHKKSLDRPTDDTPLDGSKVQFMARRLRQTLKPGLVALKALSASVVGFDEIESIAIRGYDAAYDYFGASDSEKRIFDELHPTNQPLRERIERLLKYQ